MLFDMLKSLVRGNGSFQDTLIHFVLVAITVLIALSVHEAAHGFAAWKLGDPTARNLGRLTLDPSKHLDPIGTVCMLLFGFGWAKPVPVNSRYFKKPRRDMALTALAGPASNLILSFLGMLAYAITYSVYIKSASFVSFSAKILYFAALFFQYVHILNLSLAVFNLLPVPPLDGSRILFIFLPSKYYFGIMRYERIISLVILVLLFSGALTVPLRFVANLISSGMAALIGLIPGL